MKTYQWPIHAMFGDLVVGTRHIVREHKLKDEVAGHIAWLLDDLFQTCKSHQWSIRTMFRELAVTMRQIIAAHDLEDEIIRHLANVLAHLFTTYVEREREAQVPQLRSAHPTMVELLAWLDRLATVHDDAEDAASTAAN